MGPLFIFERVNMVYGSEKFIRAHEDRSNSYYNHYYDRYVRDAICSGCGKLIGEQVKYSGTEFYFDDLRRDYLYCPYCGHKFEKHGDKNERV